MSKAQIDRLKRWVFGLAILVVALFILVPQVGELSKAWQTIRQAYWPDLVAALAAWAWTFLAAAAVYVIISPKDLKFNPTLLVQIACGFSNRLIPAGAGALATNAQYLTKQGYTKVQSGTIVAINNTLGFVASFLLLIAAGLISGMDVINGLRLELVLSDRLILTVLIITVLVFVYAWAAHLPKKLLRIIRKINYQVENSLLRSNRLLTSLVMSAGVTIGYGLCLYFTAMASNVHLSVFQTFTVLTVGVLIASITPTPGGIGGAEAGLVGVMSALGIDIHQALSVTLCYRLITYWLPILPGYLALSFARRQRIL